MADDLQRLGVVTIPVEGVSLPDLRREFRDTCSQFPEFKKSGSGYVLGGFAALANPASFHNPLVRKLRQWCMVTVLPYMSALAKGRKLEQVLDRMMYRMAGDSPSKESWHRDEAPQAAPDDITFGGWLNLDDSPQWFSCAPGSHCTTGTGGKGFHKQSKQQVEQALSKHPKARVEVPPGHLLLFYETILHEVVAEKRKWDQLRLFLGWRLTFDGQPLYSSIIQDTTNFGVPRLKSGQMPPMYAQLHWTNHLAKLEHFSRTRMVPECLHIKVRKRGTPQESRHNVVMRELPSLTDLRLPTPPPYKKHELDMLVPRRSWSLLVPGGASLRKTYHL